MDRRARTSALLVTATIAASVSLAGCSALPFLPGTTTQECVSWVDLDTQQMMAESAQLIVVGEIVVRVGEEDLLGGLARVYRFAVDEASDPKLVGAEIEIASRSDGCSTDPYARGDQLDTDERVAVFLSTDEQSGGLATLTPFDGVLPADELEAGLVPGLPRD
jgi:hypothetical protein